MKTDIQVRVNDVVQASQEDVFNSIVDPQKITCYFPSKSSGPLADGNQILWTFEDVGVSLQVDVIRVDEPSQISFTWRASGVQATVDILLEKLDASQTKIQITESSFEMNKEGVQKALQQTQGWTDFVCSLKAYIYTGINLRNGLTA
ncbi:MAG: SRPBCC domain-containing protein [Saprospiraceae bacterium]|nr:SRPBCC domain-containing protein [Saprospiraceae bacterium]